MNDNWHNKTSEQALATLNTSPSGLSEADANQLIITYGFNKLPKPIPRNVLIRFFQHFHNILIYVLLGAAGITALLDHLVDTSVIIAVVIINAVIGFLQEGKAEKAMDAIRHMLALRASVIREGKRLTIMGEQLVPGDIVLLEAGDKVPADLRLLKTHGLQIQEAILTGESIAAEKQPEPVEKTVPLGDRSCMAYSGTTITSGQGMGVVVAKEASEIVLTDDNLASMTMPLNAVIPKTWHVPLL